MTSKKLGEGQGGSGNRSSNDVGYGRPPVEHRFQKGTSGNPRGRPRKPRQLPVPVLSSIDDLVRAEAARPISIRENGIEVSLPAIQVGLRSAAHAAAKGNHRAQLMMTNLLVAAERRKREDQAELRRLYVDFRQAWREECRRCDLCGQPRPDPVPHPDEIIIDASTGELVINGPKNQLEKDAWGVVEQHRDWLLDKIKWVKKPKRLRKPWSAEFDNAIAVMQATVNLINQALPGIEMRRTPGFNIITWRCLQPPFEKELSKLRKLTPDWNWRR